MATLNFRLCRFSWALSALLGMASRLAGSGADATGLSAAHPDLTPPASYEGAAARNSLELIPMIVTAPAYRLPMTPLETMKLKFFFSLKFDFGWPPLGGGPFVITPGRLPQRIKNVAQTFRVIDHNELAQTPAFPLIRALFTVPEFGISNSAIGASFGSSSGDITLRGIQALVLLDAVPLNDPFDGGITWIEIPRVGLARAELVSGGGATAWGNGTPGGAVQFLTLPAKGAMILESGPPPDGGPPDPNLTKQVIKSTGQFAAGMGSQDTQSAEFVTSQPTSKGVLQILGRSSHTGGFSTVSSDRRGPADLAEWGRGYWIETRWRQPVGDETELVATLRNFHELHGEGSAYQRGNSTGSFASITLAGHSTLGFAWNALGYLQSGSSAHSFSVIRGNRSTAFPFLDQFAVPTTALGVSGSGAWRPTVDSQTHVGFDLRSVRGETREDLDFRNGIYHHRLIAGGNQSFAGLFLLHDQKLTPSLHATIGTRIDAWTETNRFRRDADLSSPLLPFEQHFANVHGTELSPSAGIVWQPIQAWRWRINSQQAFRQPTLGERYEIQGKNSVVTFGNPNLRAEHSTTVEVATDYSFFRPPTSEQNLKSPFLSFEVRAFLNELKDLAGHITLPRNSSGFELLDSLPSGYRGDLRTNIDRAQVQGFTLLIRWHPFEAFSIEASTTVNDATLVRAASNPVLTGNKMPEVPRNTSALIITWKIDRSFSLKLHPHLVGRRFSDSENTLPLDASIVTDLSVNYAFNARTEFHFAVENLTDRRLQTDRSLDGITYLEAPRSLRGGIQLKW